MFTFTRDGFRKLVRASAIYDLLFSLPMATPWTFAWMHAQLNHANLALGGAPFPAMAPFHMMLVNMLGSVVVVWSLVRIRNPSRENGRWDATGRFLFSLWFARTIVLVQAPVAVLFLVPELLWGILQAWPRVRDEDDAAVAGTSGWGVARRRWWAVMDSNHRPAD